MKIGTDREDRDDVTLGSAPLSSALEASSSAKFSPLQFDAQKFMQFVADEDLSEAQSNALLRACWDIYAAQVDIAFGIHPVQQAVDRLPGERIWSRHESASVVSSKSPHSDKPNDEADARKGRGPVAEEDS